MADKILCPWCGAEMRVEGQYNTCGTSWSAHARCWDCGATGPIARNVSESEKAIKNARAAALRRYTPPIKPMTFEEVERLACSDSIDDETPLYLEDVDGDNGWEISYQLRRLCFNAKDDYGKDWRCWERKPTDEERSAAEWETSRGK